MSTQPNSKVYFAADESAQCVAHLRRRSEQWYNTQLSSNMLETLRKSYALYHGAHFGDDMGSAHKISFGGEQGEIVKMAVNHYHNIAQHMINMTTASRPAMQAQAANSDAKSMDQASLANDILAYYMKEKNIESFLNRAVEMAVVLGAGYITIGWNALAGKVIEMDDETGRDLYEGDMEFRNYSPFDVVVDASQDNENRTWYLMRGTKNKFDLAAKFTDKADDIIDCQSITQQQNIVSNITGLLSDETDNIFIYEFYHLPTESVPEGRYVLYCGDDIVLVDSPLPYSFLPIFPIYPGTFMGTPYGKSPMFDLIPIQEMLDSLYSSVTSNMYAFATQNILIPRGFDGNVDSVVGGLSYIEYDPAKGKPEVMQLLQTPAEIFNYIEMLEQRMETLSGINSVTRGNPDKDLKTGPALALVQSMAVQFLSNLQQHYVRCVENLGTGMIKLFQQYAMSDRVITIAGESARGQTFAFKSDSIQEISRVTVEMANPLARTTAGRLEMAENLVKNRYIQNAEEYISVLTTGNLKPLTKPGFTDQQNMRRENEAMMRGENVPVYALDKHSKHILEHSAVIGDPELRKNPELILILQQHVMEHIKMLRTVDPGLLAMIGEQSQMPPELQQQFIMQSMGVQAPVPPGAPGQPPAGGPPQTEGPPPGTPNGSPQLLESSQNASPLVQQGEGFSMPSTGQQTSMPNMPNNPLNLPTNPADTM